MANEGLKIVGEGIALRASDIDVAYVTATASRATRAARCTGRSAQGWSTLHDTVREYHASQGELWTPAPLLAEMASRARCLEAA